MKFVQRPGAKPLHAAQATKHSRPGSFSEIGVPILYLMEINIYRVHLHIL